MNLNLFIEEQKKIVITGATGWVGQNFLNELQRLIPQSTFNDIVIAFGSKDKVISSNYYKIPIKIRIHALENIEDILMDIKEIFLIHTAFLTREKINHYGIDDYIKINENIINTVGQIISNNNNKSVVISSGAVKYLKQSQNNENNIKEDPYGFLKLREEEVFKKTGNSLILRIYGLTGDFIRDPNIFAFGNFLLSAKNNKSIIIKSKVEVIRSYVYGADVAKAALKWLFSNTYNSNLLLNAATNTISLLELANKITAIFSLPRVQYYIDKNLEKDIYISESKAFLDFLEQLQIKPTSMDEQIINTYNFLKNYS